MSTIHFNTNRIELAHRSNGGIDVTLVWLPEIGRASCRERV